MIIRGRKRTSNLVCLRKAELMPNGRVNIGFPYNHQIIDLVKKIDGRKYSFVDRTWNAKPTRLMLEQLLSNGFEFGPKLTLWDTNHKEVVVTKLKRTTPIPGLKIVPYPFQIEGIDAIDRFNGRALIGDEMGLGKTLQALGWLQLHKEIRPAVIVCPATLKEMWCRKIEEWMEPKEKVVILSGRPSTTKKLFTKASIYIVNFDIVGNKVETTPPKIARRKKKKVEKPYTGWTDFLCDTNPKCIIVDESHYCKDPTSLRTMGCIKLLRTSPNAICLSGTPVKNRPREFWPILNALCPKEFKSWWKFAKRFCGAYHNGFGWTYDGASNIEELYESLNALVMIRRRKSEVLLDLPPKQRAVIPLPVDQKHMSSYWRAVEDFADTDGKGINALTRMAALKQAAVKCKMDSAFQWIEDFLETGEKLVVFAHHHFTVDALKKRFEKITKIAEITGRTKGSKAEQEDLFQNDPECGLFIGSMSAREGLTLTAASNLAFFEFFDTPGDMAQAEDRIHRIGQNTDKVTIWYLVAAGTIEEDIAKMIDRKLKILKPLLDGRKAAEEELILSLLRYAQSAIKRK